MKQVQKGIGFRMRTGEASSAPDWNRSEEEHMDLIGADEFSVLNLRDRVVIMLLFDQIVSEESVAEAWYLWQQNFSGDHNQPLWRLMTLIPELDRELIFAEAARVYGIEEARIERRGALHIIEKMHHVIPRDLWDRMVALRVVPVDESIQDHIHKHRVIFATHDPTHPELQELIAQIKQVRYELRYAPEEEVVDLLAEAFPWKYKALKEAMEAEKALINHMSATISEEQEGAQQVSPEASGVPAPDETAPVEEEPESFGQPASFTTFFEDVLVEAVRRKVEGVCIVPNENQATEVYFQSEEGLERWRVFDHIKPDTLIATIKSSIIRSDYSARSDAQKQIIKRWIGGKPIQFRVTALPPSEKLDLESIVVRILN